MYLLYIIAKPKSSGKAKNENNIFSIYWFIITVMRSTEKYGYTMEQFFRKYVYKYTGT